MPSVAHNIAVSISDLLLPQSLASRVRRSVRKWRAHVHDGRWQDAESHRQSLVIQLPEGPYLSLNADSLLCRLIYDGCYELKERAFFSRFLKKGDSFIDVGANIGLYSVIAAHLVGARGRIYAFEPGTQSFDRLRCNVLLNKLQNVELFKIALSSVAGEADLLLNEDSGKDAWNALLSRPPSSGEKREAVSVTTLDDLAREGVLPGRVSLMKVDIEGAECCLVKGAQRYLRCRNAPALIIEFNDENAALFGVSCDYLYDLLEECNYSLYELHDDQGSLKPSPKRSEYSYCNLVALKR